MSKHNKVQAFRDGKRQIVNGSSYQGPLPPPEMLQAYSDCLPGSGETILEQFKKQGNHRRRIELTIVLGQLYFGPLLAVIVVLAAFLCGYSLLSNDKQIEGLVVIFGPLAAIGGIFIWNNSGKKKK